MFYKSFPVQTEENKVSWQEIYLTPKDELAALDEAAIADMELMDKCIEDAKRLLERKDFKPFQNSVLSIATQLFAKQADHSVYFKEKKCREILNRMKNTEKYN